MTYYRVPLLIFGYLNGIHWQDLDRTQINELESGYRFYENIEIKIANEPLKSLIETFFQNKVERFAWKCPRSKARHSVDNHTFDPCPTNAAVHIQYMQIRSSLCNRPETAAGSPRYQKSQRKHGY